MDASYTLHWSGEIRNSPCMSLAAHAMNAVAAEYGVDGNLIQDHCPVFWVECEGAPVALIHYFFNTQCWINLTYVLPEHRRKGLYRTLWNALVKKAKDNKWRTISGATSVKNCPMQEAMKRTGRAAVYTIYDCVVDVDTRVEEV